MKTFNVKAADIKKKWVICDATDKPVGRLATEIARVLRGKHRPTYTPHLDTGDNVIVINADKVKLTGRKWDQKKYYRYSGYIGGLKETGAREMLADHPDRIISLAVKGMLPRNKMRKKL